MTETTTPYGRLIVGDNERLFARAADLAAETAARANGPFSWALTGGSTPAQFYAWSVRTRALQADLLARAHWFVSDERQVPLVSPESNFGNADRQLLTPLGVAAANKHPWPVESAPQAAAAAFLRSSVSSLRPSAAFDLCFLGMGDDAHTASLFPGSPLLAAEGAEFFAAVEVPGKGWRLTITPAGLRACGRIVVMTMGAGKAAALRDVLQGPYNPARKPSQILKTCADRVTWLVDPVAAAGLGLN